VPVEDNRGNLKGIITKKRLNSYLADSSNDSLAVAADVMEPNPVTIGPNSDIKYAMLLMIDKGLSCLPVIEKNQLIGIITDRDTQEIWNKMNKSLNAKN
jgi:CBS domain-containing protein